MSLPFDEWVREVDALCLRHLLCDWHDLCGDLEPLQRSHEDQETPIHFVRYWARKYDLTWIDEVTPRQAQ